MEVPERIEGQAPDGTPVEVELWPGPTVLYFMTSSCRPCVALWPRLGAGDVAVTPSRATESSRKVAALAPPGVTVIMSSEAWFALRPGPAPWRMVVAGGRVIASGPGAAAAPP